MKRLEIKVPTFEHKRDLILYVEDEEENRDVAYLRLKRSYELVFASTDQEACQALVTHGPHLSAILMDIQLRGSTLDGVQLTKLIRGTLESRLIPPYAQNVPTLKTPLIFVTAYGNRYPEADLKQAGGDLVIHKPVNFIDLTSALTQLHLSKVK